MFNSKVFCIIVVLTAIALGAAVYLQVQEMMEYNLLAKLDKQYLSGTFTGAGDTAAEPAEPATDEDSKKDDTAADTAKKDDAAKKDDKE